MKNYIIEVDCTSHSELQDGGYLYSRRLFDSQRDAESHAKDIIEKYGEENIYLVSVYEAKSKARKSTETEGVANRIAVCREANAENSIETENESTLGFYTRKSHTGQMLMGLTSCCKEWILESNRAV